MVWTTILNTVYLAVIGSSLYIAGWLMLKAARNQITSALAACQILMMLWCIPQLFMSLPMSRAMKYLTYGISYVGISFIGPTWLRFACLYSKRRIGKAVTCILFGTAAVNYAVFWSNEYHHLFYAVFEVEQVVYGPVFYGHMTYTYLCVLAGMAVVLWDFRRRQVALKNILVIVLAAAVPLGFNLLYITGIVRAGFDLTPPAFALSSLLMLLAVFRYDLLNVNPMAFERIFDSIAEGVIVYNRNGIITYCNETAGRWTGARSGSRIEDLPPELLSCGEGRTLMTGGEQRVEASRYQYLDHSGQAVAGTFLLTDVGKYFELLEQSRQLAISNQKLAIEQERNRIAQEVHDTTGHTLTMIQSLLKLMSVAYRSQSTEARDGVGRGTADGGGQFEEYLAQAQELAGSGIRELRCAINQMRQTAAYELVTQGVYQLVGQVKGLKIDVEIQGKDGPAYSHLSPIVYSCVREAITNCLRYAGAVHMDVILKFLPEGLSLYLFDDGVGCGQIAEGNGIRGIRERVEQAGGRVRFRSEAGAGFQITIQLPLHRNGGPDEDKSVDSGRYTDPAAGPEGHPHAG